MSWFLEEFFEKIKKEKPYFILLEEGGYGLADKLKALKEMGYELEHFSSHSITERESGILNKKIDSRIIYSALLRKVDGQEEQTS